MRLLPITLSAVVLLCAAPLRAEERPPELADVLNELAADAIAYSQQQGFRNVGVTKFVVVKAAAGEAITEEQYARSLGDINAMLARRMEIALGLANPEDEPLNLIRDASAVAERVPGADLLTTAGKAELFTAEYPLHWRAFPVKADAFFVGSVRVEPDLSSAAVDLMAFSKDAVDFAAVGATKRFRVDSGLLQELGESFSRTRSIFSGGGFHGQSADPDDLPDEVAADLADADTQAITATLEAQGDAGKHPLNDGQAPVKVEVVYDGVPVQPTIENGVARVPPPGAGQRVGIRITKDNTSARYAVRVKINGESVVGRDRLPMRDCRGHVLKSPGESRSIQGYLVGGQLVPFGVVDSNSGAAAAFSFGKDIGTIGVAVFSEVRSTQKPQTTLDAYAVQSAKLPKTLPTSPSAFTEGLMKLAKRSLYRSRGGLLVPNQSASSSVGIRKVPFTASGKPVMSVTIRYADL
ncbi:MAG: hypothetical protein AAGB00_09575 [Planctomycetota bacterium]